MQAWKNQERQAALEMWWMSAPSILAPLNANGLAASTEIYLGKNMLANGEDFPVPCKGSVE
ncbi:MAG: hypothetical protein WBB33_02345 [Candidatus Saccharimonadales bacterium]